jgi:hypothetical protein
MQFGSNIVAVGIKSGDPKIREKIPYIREEGAPKADDPSTEIK